MGRARKARVEFEGALYHVMDRGDRREPIFRASADRQSRECGIETLAEACAKIGWQVTPMSSCRIIFIWWSRRPSPALRDRRSEMVSPYTSRFNRRPRASSPICSPVATNRWWWLIAERLGMGTRSHVNHLLYRQRQSGEESP